MAEFWCKTFTNPAIFWSFIQAVGTILAAIIALGIIGYEIRNIRADLGAKKFEAFRYAGTLIEGASFETSLNHVREEWKMGDKEFPDYLKGDFVYLFHSLDYISQMIKAHYLDKELFLYQYGDTLYELERMVNNFERKENSYIPNVKATFPDAYKLLKDAAKHSREVSNEIFERLEG